MDLVTCENPANSYLWLTSFFARLMKHDVIELREYSSGGARKATKSCARFLVANTPTISVSHFVPAVSRRAVAALSARTKDLQNLVNPNLLNRVRLPSRMRDSIPPNALGISGPQSCPAPFLSCLLAGAT